MYSIKIAFIYSIIGICVQINIFSYLVLPISLIHPSHSFHWPEVMESEMNWPKLLYFGRRFVWQRLVVHLGFAMTLFVLVNNGKHLCKLEHVLCFLAIFIEGFSWSIRSRDWAEIGHFEYIKGWFRVWPYVNWIQQFIPGHSLGLPCSAP